VIGQFLQLQLLITYTISEWVFKQKKNSYKILEINIRIWLKLISLLIDHHLWSIQYVVQIASYIFEKWDKIKKEEMKKIDSYLFLFFLPNSYI